MCVCVCTCVWVWVGSQEVDTRVPACINTSYESTANVSMCIDSLVAVHYDATSHGTLGCHKPLYATMLQAAQCYCGSWCGLWLTVPPPKRSSGASTGTKVKIISSLLFLPTFTQPGTPPVYICHHTQVLTKRHVWGYYCRKTHITHHLASERRTR